MNFSIQNKKNLTVGIIIAAVLIIAGGLFLFLKPAAPSQTAPAAPTVETEPAEPTPTQVSPTATALPLPTATLVPSPTSIPPLAVSDEGLTIWCQPANQVTAPPASAGLAIPPANANLSAVEDEMVLLTIPNYSCNFVFHLNQQAPAGLTMEVYDWLQKQPIFSLPAGPATDDPNAAVVSSTNAYLTSPPVWEYTYRFLLKGADGAELWTGQVHMDKGWRPNICLAGVLPNPRTLRCPLRQDSHPWDPWYGKTPVPNDDENPIP